MKEFSKITGRELSQPAQPQEDATSLQVLEQRASASPRGAVAFSAFSAKVWLGEKLNGFFKCLATGRTRSKKDSPGEPQIFILKSTIHLCAVLLVFCSCALLHAQQAASSASAVIVPRLMNFSGKLADASGKPLAQTIGVTFAIYKDQEGGAALWLETQNVKADGTGHYAVQLGATKTDGLPQDLFRSGEARWLGIQVSGQDEQPRVLLLSVPYALKAADSETLGGLPASAFMLAAPLATGIAVSSSASSVTTVAVSASPAAAVTGAGTTNFLPLWTGTNTVGNSMIFQSGTGANGKIGINTTTPLSPLDVKGATTIHGTLFSAITGNATASSGKVSQGHSFVASAFNSTSSSAENETFRWQAEPTGNNSSSPSATMNLLFGKGSASPSQTGLKIASNGQITFAAGQTFPGGNGSGTVTSVGLSAPSSDFTVSGSPVTSKGTLALNWTVTPTSQAISNAIVKRDGNGLINVLGIVSNNPNGLGVIANSTTSAGVLGGSSSNAGVWGNSLTGNGLTGQTGQINVAAGSQYGVFGQHLGVNGIGVFGVTSGNTGIGVLGFAEIGVQGSSASIDGTGAGVYALGRASSAGLYATTGPAGWAVNAYNTGTGTGVLSGSAAGFAGWFNGNVQIDGNLSKDSGSFKIDHPLDPANKYLYHSFVESPDMMNIYNGNVTTNSSGEAVVTLPEWFETLNRDFRYQLTVMGQFAQAIVAKEVADHQFSIKTDKANVKVSWQVTGIRQDKWANAHRIPVEEEKPANERGFYKHPELYGAPEEKAILWAREPNAMKQWKESRLKLEAHSKKEAPVAP